MGFDVNETVQATKCWVSVAMETSQCLHGGAVASRLCECGLLLFLRAAEGSWGSEKSQSHNS